MNSIISQKLKELPKKSGVYIMHSADGTVIYVGKAKDLKSRVSSYFNNTKKTRKVEALVEKIEWFEYIITPNELDAFALENNLIKKHQPFYNILLKDSKTFPYIKIDLKKKYPLFSVTRKVLNDGCKYFGPFLAGVKASKIVEFLNNHFKLRNCKNSLEKPLKRECVNFSIGLCPAPCTRKISEGDYKIQINKAIEFLKGNYEDVIKSLEEKMATLANNQNFEKAIEVRETYNMINKLDNHSIANLPKTVNKDAVCYMSNDITSAVAIITVRNGRILGVQTFSIMDANTLKSEIIESFIISYYENAILPDEIITNIPILNTETLNSFLGKKIKYISNPKGVNLNLLNMAKENANEHIEKNISKDKQKYDNTLGAIKTLQEKLGLKNLPRRIECYDISNISGTNKVASMVVFYDGEPQKKSYRKFKIKSVQGSNDFASLQEALTRRLTRLKNKDGESFKERPDLLIIDGGKGQLSACKEVLDSFNFDDIEIISLAKKLEEVFLPNKANSVILDHSSAPLKLLQRIRDEAHRFAITFHRQIRNKKMFASPLDDLKGLGEKKKEALFIAFNDIEKIKSASIEELSSVKGIDLKLANQIFNKFHKT